MNLQPKWNASDLMKALEANVVGQRAAKQCVASALWWNQERRRINDDGGDIRGLPRKENVLLAGPSGCGKTLILRTAAELICTPFYATSATDYSSAGYVGRNTSQMVAGLLNAANGDAELASRGVILIDEVDKIRRTDSRGTDVGGEGVQQGLLTLLEGTSDIEVERQGKPDIMFSTKDVTFIAAGAFPMIKHDRRGPLTANDLIGVGMMPEFIGRFSRLARVRPLSVAELEKILHQGSIKPIQNLFAYSGIELAIRQDALEYLVRSIGKSQIGARGLAHSVDSILCTLRDTLPALIERRARKVVLDAKTIQKGFSDLRYFTSGGSQCTLDAHRFLQGYDELPRKKSKPPKQPQAKANAPRSTVDEEVVQFGNWRDDFKRHNSRSAG